MRIGTGYDGSENVMVSTANVEVIPPTPSDWVNMKRGFYKFSLTVLQDAHIKINNSKRIFLGSGQTFEIDKYDAVIYSFVIEEAGIEYQWLGAY
ncbi:hypothetical protein ACU3L3_06720 [Priestia endophytica]